MKHLILLLLLIPYVSFASYKNAKENPVKSAKESSKSISVVSPETPAIDGCSSWQPASFTATYDPLNCCWAFMNTTTNDCMQWNCTWDFGDGTPQVTTAQGVGTACHPYVNPGTYTVTLIFDSSPCHGGSGGICTGTQTVTIPPLSVTSTLSSYTIGSSTYNISCEGGNDGWIKLSSAVGYTFEWQTTPPDYTDSIGNLTAGTYVCNIGLNGCVDIYTVTLTEPIIQMNESVLPTCFGLMDGDIILSPSGGLAPYTYLWNTGDTTSSLSNLDTGIYSVEILDAFGCIDSAIYEITESTQLSTQFTTSDYNGYNISCYGFNDGHIDLTISGSVPPYYAQWSNSQSTIDIYNLYEGTYNVDIIDANGCIDSLEVTLYEPPSILSSIVPTVNYNGYDISCNGYNDGFIDLTVSGAYPPYTYSWNNGESTEDLDSLVAGNYSVTITDTNGCVHLDYITLIDPTILFDNIASVYDYNGFEISCYNYNDGAIDLSVFGSVAPYSYQWNASNGTTQDLSNLIEGWYFVDIVDDNSCFISDSIYLSQPTQIISSYTVSIINGYNVTCNEGQDGFINLTVSGSVPGYYYQWSNGDTTEDINNLGAGIYSYTVTDQNSCITTGSIEITEPTLTIQQTSTNISCNGGTDGSASVSVSGSTAPYYVLWNNNINPNLLSVGVYVYHIVDSIGCNYIDSITILEPDSFSVSENIIHISCNGYNDGSISLSVSGATPPYVIDWFGVPTVNMTEGTYNYVITDTNLCQYSEIAIINEPNPIDVLNQVIDPSCSNTNDGSVSLSISGGTAPYTIDWGSNNPNNLGIGTYLVIITDTNNCIDSNTISVTSASNMQVTSTLTNISCEGFCDGVVDLVINSGIPPYTVNWFGINPAFICEGLITYEVTDSIGCLHVEDIQISAPDSVTVSITVSGMQLQAIANGGTPPYTYQWSDDNGVISFNPIITMITSGNYYCIAIDQNNCQSAKVRYYYTDVALTNINGIDFNIYPNPSEGFLIIECASITNSDLTVNLIDVLGQYVHLDTKKSFTGEYKNQIDLSNYAKGVYFINIKLNNQNHYRKLILQ